MAVKQAVLAGGCFWCLEAAFRDIRGVLKVTSGYTGGTMPDPDYDSVCSGSSGHAEAVAIDFDAEILSFRDLLTVYFGIHNPTTLNHQGHDVGTQYRSAIFFLNEEQQKIAQTVIAELETEHVFDSPIVTELLPLETFYPAESYHQRYYEKNPEQAYCSVVISPKLALLRKRFAHLLK